MSKSGWKKAVEGRVAVENKTAGFMRDRVKHVDKNVKEEEEEEEEGMGGGLTSSLECSNVGFDGEAGKVDNVILKTTGEVGRVMF
jgi:hypothetical protein